MQVGTGPCPGGLMLMHFPQVQGRVWGYPCVWGKKQGCGQGLLACSWCSVSCPWTSSLRRIKSKPGRCQHVNLTTFQCFYGTEVENFRSMTFHLRTRKSESRKDFSKEYISFITALKRKMSLSSRKDCYSRNCRQGRTYHNQQFIERKSNESCP